MQTCADYDCEVVVCEVVELERNTEVSMNVTILVYENALSSEEVAEVKGFAHEISRQ